MPAGWRDILSSSSLALLMAASATFSVLVIDENRFCRRIMKSARSTPVMKATAPTMVPARTTGDMDVFESLDVDEEEFVGYDDEIMAVISLAGSSFQRHWLKEKFPCS